MRSPTLNFTGLPIPGAGGFLSVLVLLFGLVETAASADGQWSLIYNQVPYLREGIPVIVFALSLLMISRGAVFDVQAHAIFSPPVAADVFDHPVRLFHDLRLSGEHDFHFVLGLHLVGNRRDAVAGVSPASTIHRRVSNHDQNPAIGLIIFDTTLRDGEQSPGREPE